MEDNNNHCNYHDTSGSRKLYKLDTSRWHILRLTHLLGGSFAFIGGLLGFLVNPLWFLLPVVVGAMQIIFALTGLCISAIIMDKCGVPRN